MVMKNNKSPQNHESAERSSLLRLAGLKISYFFLLMVLIIACKHHAEEESELKPKTPVTVTTVMHGPLSENILLNATSTYQRKHTIKSFVSAYIKAVKVVIGQTVSQGEILFTLITKEAIAYNSIKIKDSSFIKPADLLVKATSNGTITSIDHQVGEYVQEGDQLCTIAEPQSMAFILEVPYEWHEYAKINSKCIDRKSTSLNSSHRT